MVEEKVASMAPSMENLSGEKKGNALVMEMVTQ
jgi:hypothetical protein